jgi:spore coat protein U-like protein
MFIKKQVGLVALALASVAMSGVVAAAAADSTMTVSATLTSACIVSATSAIGFGPFAALAVTGDKTANSASTFQVACSNSASPTISAAGTRSMSNGATTPSLLPFNLSLVSGAANDDLSADSGAGSAFTLAKDGDLHDVVIYGKTLASNFKALPSGAYTADVTLSVTY